MHIEAFLHNDPFEGMSLKRTKKKKKIGATSGYLYQKFIAYTIISQILNSLLRVSQKFIAYTIISQILNSLLRVSIIKSI